MSALADAGSSVIGNVESAYIIVKDYRLAGRVAGQAGIDAINSTTQTMLEKGINPIVTSIYSDMDKTFKVQFNPHEMHVNVVSQQLIRFNAQVKNDKRVVASDSTQKPTVDLSVNLIFDQMNVFDSFMWDKIQNLATVNGIVGASASTAAKVNAKPYTVQTEVEGFVSAIRNPYTRNMIFQWGEFSFTGFLTNVSVKYTMFSVSGRPVRANVSLRIRHDMDDELLQNNWYVHFNKAFSGDESNLVKTEQNVQSLLNLGL